MFSLPIVDTHVHLWNPHAFQMPWLEEVQSLKRPYSLEDYREQTIGLPIEAIVCVEAGVLPQEDLLEARWLAELASHNPLIQGLVVAAPVGDADPSALPRYLEAAMTANSRVKGVRRNIQAETLPGFCLQAAFVRDIRLLSTYDLSFDLCIVHSQLPDVIELVRLCPTTHFVLDHIGKPAIRSQAFEPWRTQIQTLANLPNITCKLSGLVTEADHQEWTAEDLAPYITHVLAAFGAERVLFGGDWPVLLLASSYQRWLETLNLLTASLPTAARRQLWSENAHRVYRLPAP